MNSTSAILILNVAPETRSSDQLPLTICLLLATKTNVPLALFKSSMPSGKNFPCLPLMLPSLMTTSTQLAFVLLLPNTCCLAAVIGYGTKPADNSQRLSKQAIYKGLMLSTSQSICLARFTTSPILSFLNSSLTMNAGLDLKLFVVEQSLTLKLPWSRRTLKFWLCAALDTSQISA